MLRGIFSICKKELQDYFYSLIAYVFLILFVLISNIFFFTSGGIFKEDNATMRLFFTFLPYVFVAFIPGLTMGIWSKEKNLGTIELLFTLPVSQIQVLIGKFFASLAVIMIALLSSLSIPVFTSILLGSFDWGQIFTQYLGAILIASCYIAITFFFSSLTKEVINSFLLSLFVLLILNIMGLLAGSVQFYPWLEWVKVVLNNISLSSHFSNFSKGVIDSRDLFYYLGVIVIFFYFTQRSLESKRWS